MILAKSIRAHHFTVDIIVGLPQPEYEYGKVEDEVLSQFTALNCKLLHIENSISHSYKYGNKIQLLHDAAQSTITDHVLFLDSDIIQLRPLEFSKKVLEAEISYRLAGGKSGPHHQFMYLLKKFGITPPTTVYRTSLSHEIMNVPYGNAGVILISRAYIARGFTSTWIRLAKDILADAHIVDKFPWLDQISLVMTVLYLKSNLALLSADHNYAIHRSETPSCCPQLCHYHDLKVGQQTYPLEFFKYITNNSIGL